MKLKDAIWWQFNKKPTPKNPVYYGNIMYWGFASVFFMIDLVFIMLMASGSIEVDTGSIVMAVVLTVVVSLWFIYGWQYDKKRGYIDAIHKRYMKNRKEFMDKYGLKD